MKILYILLLLGIFHQKSFSQSAALNHYSKVFTIESFASLGKNNYGPGAMLGFFFAENHQIRIGGTYRFFEYKTYKENIIESNLDYSYTFYNSRYSRIFRDFNFIVVGGVALEIVKNKSEMKLIDPYPTYNYVSLGLNIEYVLMDNLSINIMPRQFYALNGSKETLGNWRYDISLGIKYYFF